MPLRTTEPPIHKPVHYGLKAGTLYLVKGKWTLRQRIGLWLIMLPGRIDHWVRVKLRCRLR